MFFNPQPKPEKRGKKPPKPIRRRSKKRAAQERRYSQLRKEFLLTHTVCPVTGGRATEIHHMKGREEELLLDTNYWLAVSRSGHRKIESNPKWAKEMGFSVDRTH